MKPNRIALSVFGATVLLAIALIVVAAVIYPEYEEKKVPIWALLLLVVMAAIVGGLSSILGLYLILLRDKFFVTLPRDALSTEILNLRTSVRLIYAIGPVLAIFLAILGVKGWEDFSEAYGVKKQKELQKELAGEIRKVQQLRIDLESYGVVDKVEFIMSKYLHEDGLSNKVMGDQVLKTWFRDLAQERIREPDMVGWRDQAVAGYLKESQLEQKVLGNNELRKWAAGAAVSVYDSTDFVSKLAENLKSNAAMKDWRSQAVDGYLKESQLAQRVLGNNELRNWAAGAAVSVYDSTDFVSKLVSKLQNHPGMKDWRDLAVNDYLPVTQLESKVMGSDRLRIWAKAVAVGAAEEGGYLKDEDIVQWLQDTESVRVWIESIR